MESAEHRDNLAPDEDSDSGVVGPKESHIGGAFSTPLRLRLT